MVLCLFCFLRNSMDSSSLWVAVSFCSAAVTTEISNNRDQLARLEVKIKPAAPDYVYQYNQDMALQSKKDLYPAVHTSSEKAIAALYSMDSSVGNDHHGQIVDGTLSWLVLWEAAVRSSFIPDDLVYMNPSTKWTMAHPDDVEQYFKEGLRSFLLSLHDPHHHHSAQAHSTLSSTA